MTSAAWKNFYVSEYDQEMHIAPRPDFDHSLKRKNTEIDYAIEAIERARETLCELQETTDPHACKSILESAQAKIRDVDVLMSRLERTPSNLDG